MAGEGCARSPASRLMSPSPPRILHVSHTSLVSGAEHSLLDLAAGLSALADVQLAAPHGDLLERARLRGISTVPVRQVDLTFKADRTALARAALDAGIAARELSASIRGGRRDVLHANSVRAALFGGPVARRHRVPLVMHVRDVLPGGLAGRAARRATAHQASRIVAISAYAARAFCDGLPAALAARVTVVDNPVDLRRFARRDAGARAAARRQLGLTEEQPVLAIVGQITAWKGHDLAVRVLAAVRARHPDAVLLVVGEVKFVSAATTLDNPSFRRDLERLAAELDLPADAVRYLGERGDVPRLLEATDLLLAPSTVEPFGRSIAEAMAVGVPALATRRGGPPEFVEHERTGWLLDPADAAGWSATALAALGDPERLARIGGAAADAARARFSCDRHAAAMFALLDAVRA